MESRNRNIGAAVGAQIKLRRQQRGVTAAELSRRAGLSKGALSTIESGRGNPTIDTLDALAFALRLPLTDLLSGTSPGVVTHQRGTAWDGVDVRRELLERLNTGQALEVWRLRMPARTSMDGVPHATGTVEHLVIASGSLRAGPSDQLLELRTGDCLSFPGDDPHRYITGEDTADVTVLLSSPVH